MKLLPFCLCIAAIIGATSSCEKKQSKDVSTNPLEAWNRVNDPLNFSGEYVRRFNLLPSTATLETTPWSDWYWASQTGGIAFRWVTGEVPFSSAADSYTLPNEAQVRNMSANELASLSPAEKYDIYRGRFDFPLTHSEMTRTSPNAASWEGLCHGWAPAAFMFKEPKPVYLNGASGVSIPFGSSDIKALLTYFMANVAKSRTRFLGARCNVDLTTNPGAAPSPECRDTNAGSFHVALTNQIGLVKKAFLADIQRDAEVWNQPIYGYTTKVIGNAQSPSAGAAPGTVKEITVETTMLYTTEIEPTWSAVLGTSAQNTDSITYRYRLELNASEDIIGGEWLSEDRPDFLWMMEPANFSNDFVALGNIYQASTGGTQPDPTPTITPTVEPTVVPTVDPYPTIVPTVDPYPTIVPTVDPYPTIVPTVDPYPTVIPTPIDPGKNFPGKPGSIKVPMPRYKRGNSLNCNLDNKGGAGQQLSAECSFLIKGHEGSFVFSPK